MTAATFQAALRRGFILWMLLFELPSATLTVTAQPAPTNTATAPIDATRNDRPGWAPWTTNSIQPPPVIQPAKLPPLTLQSGDGETEFIVRQAKVRGQTITVPLFC